MVLMAFSFAAAAVAALVFLAPSFFFPGVLSNSYTGLPRRVITLSYLMARMIYVLLFFPRKHVLEVAVQKVEALRLNLRV